MQKIKLKPHRSMAEIDDPMPDELYTKVQRMKEPYRSLTAFLYLTGNRVSEVVGIPLTEKERRSESPVWLVEPIRKYDLEITPGEVFVRASTRTLKRKDRPEHKYFCRINTIEEKRYWKIIKHYIENKQPEEYLWNLSRYKAWRYCNEATHVHPHKLRGLRATRDAIYFELDAIELKKKFNWEDPSMAFHYAEKNAKNIEDKMLRKTENT